jgi:hypothetical protein
MCSFSCVRDNAAFFSRAMLEMVMLLPSNANLSRAVGSVQDGRADILDFLTGDFDGDGRDELFVVTIRTNTKTDTRGTGGDAAARLIVSLWDVTPDDFR